MIRVNLLRAHGTDCRYARGCRCRICRAAHTAAHCKWIDAHPGYVAAQMRKRSKEDNAAYVRAWRAAHPGASPESCKRWREAHPEKAQAAHRNWRAANPEHAAALSRAGKARKRMAEGTHTGADVKAQYKRQRGKCFWGRKINPDCAVSLKDGYHVDHVTPLVKKGSNGTENIVISCPRCNMAKHSAHPMDWAGVMF